MTTLPPPRSAAATCLGQAVWQQRFDYAIRLKISGDTTSARQVLVPALADCDAKVRGAALGSLKKITDAWSSILQTWRDIRGQLGAITAITIKTITVLILAFIAIGFCRLISLFIYRKQLLVQPLNVSGDGISGQSFVYVTNHVSLMMDTMRWNGAPGQSAWRANLSAGNATELAAQVSVAEAFVGDGAGRIIAALVTVVKQPRFLCSGTVYISNGRAQTLLQLYRRSYYWPRLLLMRHWQDSCPSADLMDHLKQLSYEVLLAAAISITGDGIVGEHLS